MICDVVSALTSFSAVISCSLNRVRVSVITFGKLKLLMPRLILLAVFTIIFFANTYWASSNRLKGLLIIASPYFNHVSISVGDAPLELGI